MTITSQTLTTVIKINTPGPRGPQGIQGPSGSFDTSSLVTTSSFNNFTSSYNTGSFSGSFKGNLLGTSSTSSYHAFGLQAVGGSDTSTLTFVTENGLSTQVTVNNVVNSLSSSYSINSSSSLSSSYAASSSYAVSSSYVPNIRPYTTYTALVTQQSTNAPTDVVLENTLNSGVLTWNYVAIGEYTLVSENSIFHSNKTFLNSVGINTNTPQGKWLYWVRTDNYTITFYSLHNGSGEDDFYTNIPVEIRVYN